MAKKVVITTDRTKLSEFFENAKDRGNAVDVVGRRLVAIILSHEANLAEQTVLGAAGIEVELLSSEFPKS